MQTTVISEICERNNEDLKVSGLRDGTYLTVGWLWVERGISTIPGSESLGHLLY
jgi:hypothetical protein